jgi:GNAT superfamily N-acetyltransferase
VVVREADEADASRISAIFRATYGDDYAYPEFYDEKLLKKMIFSDDTIVLVAERTDDGLILGTASVVMDVGAFSDLLGEFGRLAVHPEARGHGVGKLLMEGRLNRIRDRLHIGITEARVIHPYSQKIAERYGFAAVGFLPMKVQIADRREHVALMYRHFGPAIDLRRNNPRIVPEVYGIAAMAMDHVGLANDVIVDEATAPYPYGDGYEIVEMTADGYSDLLRIERGRVRNREVFGPLQLHYGVFMLQAKHSNYLIARDKGRIVGAIGFTLDKFDRDIRVFELITLDDHMVRFLFEELVRYGRDEHGIVVIEVDVAADATRMQRTLMELGFVPCAYVPAMAFQRVERRDVVKFVRLLEPLVLGEVALIETTQEIADVVLAAFRQRQVVPRISEVVDRVELFDGLNDEQVQRVARIASHRKYAAGDNILMESTRGEEMYLILSGEVDIVMSGSSAPIGSVGPGECLGEVAMLTRGGHMANGVARTQVEAGVLTCERIGKLVRLRPDIGVVLYRNVARGLGDKLRRADFEIIEEAK